ERHDAVRAGITNTTHGKEIAQLLFFEDLEQVVLLGTSSGGMVIVKAAELGRERIRRLVFVDALALSPGEQHRLGADHGAGARRCGEAPLRRSGAGRAGLGARALYPASRRRARGAD